MKLARADLLEAGGSVATALADVIAACEDLQADRPVDLARFDAAASTLREFVAGQRRRAFRVVDGGAAKRGQGGAQGRVTSTPGDEDRGMPVGLDDEARAAWRAQFGERQLRVVGSVREVVGLRLSGVIRPKGAPAPST
jgi:hypothetical protein